MNIKYSFRLLLIATAFSSSALASLGDLESSIDHDSETLRAKHRVSKGAGYTIHQLKTSTSTVVEYVSSAGSVFEVTWRGAGMPDLSTLLGANYTDYTIERAKLAKTHSREASEVKTAKMIVSSSGHMRYIHGRAYIPDLVPTGIDVRSLK